MQHLTGLAVNCWLLSGQGILRSARRPFEIDLGNPLQHSMVHSTRGERLGKTEREIVRDCELGSSLPPLISLITEQSVARGVGVGGGGGGCSEHNAPPLPERGLKLPSIPLSLMSQEVDESKCMCTCV